MGTFGNEFVVVDTLRATAPGAIDVSIANQNSAALQRALDALAAQGGGFLYLPPGRYLLGRRGAAAIGVFEASVDAGDVVVYEQVTLWFAPGAVLVPLGVAHAPPRSDLTQQTDDDRDVRVEIHGVIRALRAPIFDVSVEGSDNPSAGRVIFAGRQVRELYPEWWGAVSASPGSARRNALAIQACLDAAHRHRKRPLRGFRHSRIETLPPETALAMGLLHTGLRTLVGMRLDARASVLVEVYNCFLVGAADPLLDARSGWFSLQSCTSHTHRLEDPRSPAVVNAERSTPNGTDVYLATPTARSAGGEEEAWAGATIKDFECQSWQFLATGRSREGLRPGLPASTLIMNLNYANASGEWPGGPHTRDEWLLIREQPAIFWDGPGNDGGDLIVMGALLSARLGATVAGRPRGFSGGTLHISAGTNGRVYDLGITSRVGATPPDRALFPAENDLFGTDAGITTVTVRRAMPFTVRRP